MKFKLEISRKVSDQSGASVAILRDKEAIQLRRLDATGRPVGHPITMPVEQARLVAQAIAYTCNELYAEQALAGDVSANVIQLVVNDNSKKAG
jgi:hypothetical protein